MQERGFLLIKKVIRSQGHTAAIAQKNFLEMTLVFYKEGSTKGKCFGRNTDFISSLYNGHKKQE